MKVELNGSGILASINGGGNRYEEKLFKKSTQHMSKDAIHKYLGLILGVAAFFSSLFMFIFEVIFKFSAELLVPFLDYSIIYYFILAIIACIVIELISILRCEFNSSIQQRKKHRKSYRLYHLDCKFCNQYHFHYYKCNTVL